MMAETAKRFTAEELLAIADDAQTWKNHRVRGVILDRISAMLRQAASDATALARAERIAAEFQQWLKDASVREREGAETQCDGELKTRVLVSAQTLSDVLLKWNALRAQPEQA